MSNEEQKVSLMQQLENNLLALESAVGAEETLFYVDCILKGFITNGTWAPEYLDYVRGLAVEQYKANMKQTRIIDTPPGLVLPK
ncbi:MAG TPA: hypothetical protein VFM18_11810 [Methanosarcina sp.]|nr:hypothetical protein [Methanosarcina sp.]